jgi:hypothetical protein
MLSSSDWLAPQSISFDETACSVGLAVPHSNGSCSGFHEKGFEPVVHSNAVLYRESSKGGANEFLLALFRAEDPRKLSRGTVRVARRQAAKTKTRDRSA